MAMLKRKLEDIRTWLFLRGSGAVFGRGVVLEGRSRITLGEGVMLADGVKIRSRSLRALISIGEHSRLRELAEVNAKGEPVRIGANCFLAKEVWIGGSGAITIGRNTMIGIRTIVVSSDHDYVNITVPYYDGSEIPKLIVIGDNVWIGSNCVILGGTVIGSGSVVGAGSVVDGVFPENSMVVGVPGVLKRQITRQRPLPSFD
jgi:acetyltransferase-like isoleucine patch superfamily enzyme